MNLKYTKQKLIKDIENAHCNISFYSHGDHSIDSMLKKMIDERVREYGRCLCIQIASAIDQNIYSSEEQEKDLGIR